MKLKELQKYETTFPNGNRCVLVYTGLFNLPNAFKCDCCGKVRAKTHEFLEFSNIEKANEYINSYNEIENTFNESLWNGSYHYGTECIKKIDIVSIGNK
jgi:hypothetical protein